jgi:hypothetical protein
MSKVDDDTIAELKRLTVTPGHERLGMVAKGCMLDLLKELAELRAESILAKAKELDISKEAKAAKTALKEPDITKTSGTQKKATDSNLIWGISNKSKKEVKSIYRNTIPSKADDNKDE